MNGTNRASIKPGLRVAIVLKKDQRTGKRTEGVVKDILTTSPHHPHGIKVRLTSGDVGRVKEILKEGEINRGLAPDTTRARGARPT
ncbi:MAG TPA: YwbE family protein [Methanomicrobia archaeon]|nr:YwbE family protein [Methanomicrobia archaeon]